MRSIFARHAVPKVVFNDNGPQYSSHDFKKYFKLRDFIHKTFSPEFPKSNGFLERAIQTVNKTLWKYRADNSDPYLVMLALRTAKNSSGTSTSELLMKRKLRLLVLSLNLNVNIKIKLNSQQIQKTSAIG